MHVHVLYLLISCSEIEEVVLFFSSSFGTARTGRGGNKKSLHLNTMLRGVIC